jgi:hypothetical protein
METRDLVVTPLVVLLVLSMAYLIRPYVTDVVNRRYFFPALIVKITGAIAVGIIYQFYYSGGDTYNFHTHGSRHIWDAFINDPEKGLAMMLSEGEHEGSFYQYSSKILFFTDPSSYFVIRVSAFFDLFTFSTYSATAVCFAVLSFMGMWLFFLTFYRRYPALHGQIAFATLFIPSVFFWGSGVLKDTLMMACIGVLTYELDQLFFQRKVSLVNLFLLCLSVWCIFSVKKFILQAYLPAALFWVYLGNLQMIRSTMVRLLAFPIIVIISVFSAYYASVKIGEGDKKYAVENLAKTAKITAYDIGFYTGRDAGSGYSLGELDGTISGMVKLAPQAINVALFRPYLWEVRNPLMLLSALESLVFFGLTLLLLFRNPMGMVKSFRNPDVSFLFIFAIVFAFAVGVSSFNFGTLSRYKIPLVPFYALALVLMFQENKRMKREEFDTTE